MPPEPSVDGFTTDSPPEPDSAKSSARTKTILLIIFLVPYTLYILWSIFLLSILPSVNSQYHGLVPIGLITSAIGGVFLLLIAFLLVKRITAAGSDPFTKYLSLAKVAGVLLPGLALSAYVPVKIPQEPPLSMEIVAPESMENLTAPLSVTYSLESAEKVLAQRGRTIERVKWDFDGDGEPNEETLQPLATAIYDNKGSYSVVAHMLLDDGSQRRVATRLVIPDSVFSVFPLRPLIDEPVTFSVANLLTEGTDLKEVSWDFNNDGEFDEVTSEKEISFTYSRPGPVVVVAEMTLGNQSQVRLDKEILVSDPPPLPFPVAITTEPANLVGPAPFGVLFGIETEEPYDKIEWNIGDGKVATGDRVGHTFEKNGNYYVTARVFSSSGSIAKLSKTVRVVEALRLPDLNFTGSHSVSNRKVTAEVPLSLELKPRTDQPLIDFSWEVPNASEVESTTDTLKATFRRAGSYTVTLVASGPSGKVLRMPITVEVKPPSSQINIRMQPEGGVAPLQVRFDASETVIPGEEITGFEWKFGTESSPVIQGGAQVDYLFEKPGTFKVFATAFTTGGNTFSANRTIVVRAPVLDACFTASRTSGTAPLGVSFDMSCTTGMPAKIEWDFGDEAQSDEKNPVHVFERPGVYNVILKLQDEQGTTSQEMLTITANSQ